MNILKFFVGNMVNGLFLTKLSKARNMKKVIKQPQNTVRDFHDTDYFD
jgi:hypothetical protein